MAGLEPTMDAEPKPASPLVTRDPNRVVYETDALGRKIGVRRLTALDLFELSGVLGEQAGNAAMLNQAMTAASVVSINGEQRTRPIGMIELKARIQELDFAGYAAAFRLSSSSTRPRSRAWTR